MTPINQLLGSIHQASRQAEESLSKAKALGQPSPVSAGILTKPQEIEFKKLVSEHESSILNKASFLTRAFVAVGNITLPKTVRLTEGVIAVTTEILNLKDDSAGNPDEQAFDTLFASEIVREEKRRLSKSLQPAKYKEIPAKIEPSYHPDQIDEALKKICSEQASKNVAAYKSRGMYTTALGASLLALGVGGYFYSRKS